MTDTPMTSTPLAEAPPKRKAPAWDIALSVILLVIVGITAMVCSVIVFISGMRVDGCGIGECNTDIMMTADVVVILGGLIVVLVAIALTIVRIVLARRAFWVPIAAFVLILVLTVIGFALYEVGLNSPSTHVDESASAPIRP